MDTHKHLARHLRHISLLLAALLLAACSSTRAPSQATTTNVSSVKPDGVQRILAADTRHVIFEGLSKYQGAVFPDGRIWALERKTGDIRLLTTSESFGEHFFASGAALTPNGDAVYVKVNRTNDGDNLYRIDLGTGRATFVTDAVSLGLTEILEDSLLVFPGGERLAFSAYSERLLESPQPNGENFVWLMGVYMLETDDPAGSLKLIRQEDGRGIGQVLEPSFDTSGTLQVEVTQRRSAPQDFSSDLGPELSFEDLRRFPLERLKALEDRALAFE